MREFYVAATTWHFYVLLVSSTDHLTGVTGLTTADMTINKSNNGEADVDITGNVTLVEIGYGRYYLSIATADIFGGSPATGEIAWHIEATGCDPLDRFDQIVGFNPSDGGRLGLTSLPSSAAGAANGLPKLDANGKLLVYDNAGNAVAPATDTQAIKAKTGNLPADPASEAAVEAAMPTVPAPVSYEITIP